ncbi:MAG: glycoside hydrolase family 28 protein [Sedimentisphaerales bacterium]|nr:glycoside hydrolase family 28 protein [Sedimentisphaerales bacterium]
MKASRVHLLWVLSLVAITCSGVQAQALPFTSVKDCGAVADGTTKDTEAIRAAIDKVVQAGGGTVYFPAGQYLTGPIHLQSNITLYLDAGAVLKFSTDFDDYLPMVKSRWEGLECINFSPQIYAYDAENIAIVGRGVIDGQGKAWWDAMRRRQGLEKYTTMFAEKNADAVGKDYFARAGNFLRPPMIQPVECRRVRIEGVKLQNPPFWTCNLVYCDDVVVTGISIKNPANSPNTDGINPDSCRNVHISDCHISVGDDCVTIKSGRDEDGRRVGRPCENITVTNCTMLDGHGGVVIGSEMSGGVKKVTISNCVFDGTDKGIRMKTTRGRGGVVEDIRVSNIMMTNIPVGPIYLNMFYTRAPEEPLSERTPAFGNIHFSNITVKGAPVAGYILGLPERPVENVTFTDINMDAETGFQCKDAKGVAFHDVTVNTQKGPALICENTTNLEISGFRSLTPHEGTPIISLTNVRDAYIRGCWAAPHTGTFLALKGAGSSDIFLQGNHLKRAASAVSMQDGFPESALTR